MLRVAAAIAIVLSLATAPSAMATDKPMGWFATSVRSVFIFHSCTERLKEKFNIGPLTGLEVTNMDTDAKRADGAMDVRFEAITTEKKTARKTHFAGVCHVGPEGETRIDARRVSQSGGEIRRINPGKAG
ncbi:MAG: hypothetical protein H7236_05355 [Gemmatimonadaceae bacterium]|nr:hypothetical protein [Caulobacter sp.]